MTARESAQASQTTGRVLVVGGGVVYQSGGVGHLKKSLAVYLAHLSREFGVVHWIGARSRKPMPYDQAPAGITTAEAWSALAREWAGLVWERCNGTGRAAAVLHLPNLVAVAAAPLLLLGRIPTVVYCANDWWREAQGQFERGRSLRGVVAWMEIFAGLCAADARFGRNLLCNRRAGRWGLPISAAASLRESVLPLADAPVISPGRRILFIGKLEESKGLNHLLQAFARALASGPGNGDVRLGLMGQAKSAEALQASLAELGLAGRVDLLGFVDDQARVLQLLDEAAVVCVASIAPEGFPRVIEEASARGKPLIVAENPSLADLPARHGGLLSYRADSSEQLGALLVRLLGDDGLRAELARRSLDWARANPLLRTTAAEQHRAALAALLSGTEAIL